jgi:hypothetical protein
MSRNRRILPALIALALSAAALSACGGGDSAAIKPAPGSPENPLHAQAGEPDVPGVTRETTKTDKSGKSGNADKQAGSGTSSGSKATGSKQPSGSTPSSEPTGAQGTQAPGYDVLVSGQQSKPQSRFSPCNLVTEAQARSIVGTPMQQPLEAPQGPTCVYRSRSGKDFISLAVQTTSYAKIKRTMRNPSPVSISGRDGICGKLGQPTLYLPLSSGKVLSIGAPCDVAKSFAAKALPHL